MARFDATTTLLTANSTFTGNPSHADTYDSVVGTVFADKNGTAYVDQSPDGTNWDASTSIAVTANTGAVINVPLIAPYFRVRYVNGAADQGVFRLKVKATAAGTR